MVCHGAQNHENAGGHGGEHSTPPLMKTDRHFPPPPQFNQAPLPCDDITPQRLRAILRAEEIAQIAESLIALPLNDELPFPGTARGFALHCVRSAGTAAAEAIAQLVGAPKLKSDAADTLDGVMLIHPREHWGVIGPMRGDLVLYSDEHAAVVTKPLCMGCAHFEAVTLGGDPPVIAKVTQWLAAVKWIVRAVDESEPPPAALDMASPDVRAALDAEADGKRAKKKRTGIG